MIGLSELHARRAADTANLCRDLSREIPRPTMTRRGKFAASVGADGTVFLYEFDGFSIYRAQFDVNPEGAICWINNDIAISPSVLAPIIDAHFAAIFLRHQQQDRNSFYHWCSLSCFHEHNEASLTAR